MAHPDLLTDQEIAAALVDLPDWSRDGNRLVAEFVFADFVTAFGVMAETALHAERLGHHPEWSNVYGQLNVGLTTHDAGGITGIDLVLAQCVSRSATAR